MCVCVCVWVCACLGVCVFGCVRVCVCVCVICMYKDDYKFSEMIGQKPAIAILSLNLIKHIHTLH